MDHSLVQNILDHANTRGTAILMKTVREMVRDKNTVLVALISIIPIIIGLIWSGYLSDNEDIHEVEIENVRDTSDIFCFVGVPEFLPNSGNFTFDGSILNRGDTTQQVAVNITIGNAKLGAGGIRVTTGIMNVAPYVAYSQVEGNESSPNDTNSTTEPHQFTITYLMDDFKIGTTYITIEIYVNNSISSGRLLPDEIDLTGLDFDQFNLDEIMGGRNQAVWIDNIEIRNPTVIDQRTQDLHVGKETEFMPLTIRYPSMLTPDADNILYLSIANPRNATRIVTDLKLAENDALLDSHTLEFNRDLDIINFTLDLPRNFTGLGFDKEFLVYYKIVYQGNTTYHRNGIFSMDIVRKEFLNHSEERTFILNYDTLYSGHLEYPGTFVADFQNTVVVNLTNNNFFDARFIVNVTLNVDEGNGTITPYSIYQEFLVARTDTVRIEFPLPVILDEMFNVSYYPIGDRDGVFLEFSFSIGNLSSEMVETGYYEIIRFSDLGWWHSISLEDTFTTSLDAEISLPKDISKKREGYTITGTINNTASIKKEFWVRVTLQGIEYRTDWFNVSANEEVNYSLYIPTENHSKEFDSETRLEVFSSRTLEAKDPEANATEVINIISQGHKERKVLENFLFVYVQLYMKFIVPLIAMVYGISLISQETERRTLALYLTTPMAKAELVLYKFGGYLIAMTTMLSIPLILIYFSFSYVLSFDLIIFYLLLLGVCIFDLFLAVAAYGAVFTTIGTIERRPVFIGLSYLMIWEMFMGSLGIFLSQYTLFYHIRCAVFPFVERYVPNAMESMGLLDRFEDEFVIPMEVSMSVIILVVFVLLFFGINILASRDVN